MKKLTSVLLLVVFSIPTLWAQQLSQREEWIPQDSAGLASMRAFAIAKGFATFIKGEDHVAELMGFGHKGIPFYYKTDNLNAARTIGTNRLWTGGNLNLNLDGDSMIVGEWDGGKVRTTHREFGGRAFQMDGASSNSNHATHVGGTIIGSGVTSSAKGMAHKARLNAYDWNLDQSEMNAAAQAGLILSNHSYGRIAGWYKNETEDRWEWYGDTSINADEDWTFGFYDNTARQWDITAFNNPNYLIVRSAGNNRNNELPANVSVHYVWNASVGDWVKSSTQRSKVGPYDCLAGAAVSKNVLSIGAVNAINNGYTKPADVVMSTFSSWGPTDDGRIKPDLVANGVGLNSAIASADDAYASYNGTSMATPSVTGSLLLLQQYHRRLFGNTMRATTIKALAIHTADEAGIAEGPDYSFGWGLVNTAKAAVVLANTNFRNRKVEATLNRNGTYELTVYVDGSTPFRSTLVWHDAAATVTAAAFNNRTSKLVNNLNMKVMRLNDGQEYFPWVLDPEDPGAAATTGINNLDNVEQVHLATPTAGFYKIIITHSGSLSTSSVPFSFWISGESPKMQVDFIAPDSVCAGTTFQLTPAILGNPDQYEWTISGVENKMLNDSAPSITLETPGLYTIKLKASNPASADSIEKTQVLQVLELPTISLTPFPSHLCLEDSSAQTFINASGISWTGKGVANNQFFAHLAGVGQHWSMGVITGANGCSNSDSIMVEVQAGPAIPTITFNNNNLSSNASGTYQWYLNGQAISGANAATHTPIQTGFYQVGVSGPNGCETRSLAYDYIHTSVRQVVQHISLYPNPAKNQVQLNTTPEMFKQFRLTDQSGKILLSGELNPNGHNTLQIEGLAPGFYILNLISDQQQVFTTSLLVHP